MLDVATLERMAAKAGDGRILVALSGGGDSVALLHLLAEHFGVARLHAVVVDHALREGSAGRAAQAVLSASKLGISTTIETLHWDEGVSRGHAAARDARYSALCAAARRIKASVVATGHTRDDQAETVLLRAARGSGLRGLSGMRVFTAMPIWPEGRGLWLARPLLGVRRAALRRYLEGLRTPSGRPFWIEDPANFDQSYARVRARLRLETLENDHCFDSMRLADLAERLAPHVDHLDAGAAALVNAAARFEESEISVDRSLWVADEIVRQRALQALVAAAGGHPRGPSFDQTASLNITLAAPNFSATTLAGALVRARGGSIVFSRDRGALEGRADGALPMAPLPLNEGEEAIWDRRLALTATDSGWSVVIEHGAPILSRGGGRAPLSHANARWLLAERVEHLLDAPWAKQGCGRFDGP